MLERASTCLDTGGRRLFQTSKKCLRSRRMLHSSFWYHGASALNLPMIWPASSILDRTFDNTDSATEPSQHGKASPSHAGPMLDFLYPLKTMAMLHRLAKHGFESGESSSRHHLGQNRIRRFSTSQLRALPDEGTLSLEQEATRLEFQLNQELKRRLAGSTALDALSDLLDSDERDRRELAWKLYTIIPSEHHTAKLDAELLTYLMFPSTRDQALRILQVFDGLAQNTKPAACYRAAISAHLFLDQTSQAIELHKHVQDYNSRKDVGTGLILGHTISSNDWETSLRVFGQFFQNTKKDHGDYMGRHVRNIDAQGDSTDNFVWGEVSKLPYIGGHLVSFLHYLQSTTPDDMENAQMFMEGLAREAMEQVLLTEPHDEDVIWKFFLDFFQDIGTLGLHTSSLYNYAISRFLQIPRYQEFTNRRKPYLKLYEWFRNSTWGLAGATEQTRSGTIPTRKLLRQLMYHVGRHQSAVTVRERVSVGTLVLDNRHFYPERTFPLSTLKFLVHFYARRGEAEQVHDYVTEIKNNYLDKIDLHILSALPYVYARRIDIKSTEEQFARIEAEFGMTPNIVCWNALLLAYARADDLDGTLACFNKILESGLVPEIYTISPILELCAGRGDVEAFETIFTKADQLKINVRGEMFTRAGYVRACLLSKDPKGAEAIANKMYLHNKANVLPGSVTFVWNLLINEYALQGDLSNTQRLYRDMNEKKIPLDTWTYATLMRALIEVRQTNAAFKIVRKTMPQNNMRVHAFHYALVMMGFLREGQYKHAMRAYNMMCDRSVEQTHESRRTALRVLGMTELRKLAVNKPNQPRQRLVAVEEALRDIVLEDYQAGVARFSPRLGTGLDSRANQLPDDYFGLLILLYTARGAYDICKELYETAKIHPTSPDTSIQLLIAIMQAHFAAKEYDEVAKCFQLAHKQADLLVKTFQTASADAEQPREPDPLTDSSLMQAFRDAKISPNRRRILTSAIRIYIRSLLQQKNEKALQQAQLTLRTLLTKGYMVENSTWNEMIRALAQRGHVFDAFTACEMYLMPNFRGWREENPYYIRKNVKYHAWMEVRPGDVDHMTIMPQYKSLVALAATLAQIKRDEANGLGYNQDTGRWSRDVVEQLAPMTVRAIETMPLVGDFLQKKWLGVQAR